MAGCPSQDKSKRHVTFSKRKAGLLKKAFELSELTGTHIFLVVATENGEFQKALFYLSVNALLCCVVLCYVVLCCVCSKYEHR